MCPATLACCAFVTVPVLLILQRHSSVDVAPYAVKSVSSCPGALPPPWPRGLELDALAHVADQSLLSPPGLAYAL